MADNAFAPDRPAPGSFEETLEELYQGEVGGEAFFCALLESLERCSSLKQSSNPGFGPGLFVPRVTRKGIREHSLSS